MRRDDVIEQVANIVGKRHSVDLKHYDLLILVEIYKVRKPFAILMVEVLSWRALLTPISRYEPEYLRHECGG